MNIAVIPARGGSKRIPRKNTRDFCGRPIMEYSIEAARKSEVFDRIIVSTDSQNIAEVAVKSGAEVPFLRPDVLSDDHTPTIPVIRHAVEWFNDHDEPVDFACCIYATAPFVHQDDLKDGLQKLKDSIGSSFAFPITTFAFPIFRALKLNDDQIEMYWPENEMTRSQDLPEAWHDAGQFYWGTAQAWKNEKSLFSNRAVGLPVPRYRVQDIDTLEDWRKAEQLFRIQATIA